MTIAWGFAKPSETAILNDNAKYHRFSDSKDRIICLLYCFVVSGLSFLFISADE